MRLIRKTYKGWAINLNSGEGHSLLGRFHWHDGKCWRIPPHLEGHVTALYATRREAREELRRMKSHPKTVWPNARVERVTVDISVER